MITKRFYVECGYVKDKEKRFLPFPIEPLVEAKRLCDVLNSFSEENAELKELNIPIDEIKDTVIDARGRTVGVYYND